MKHNEAIMKIKQQAVARTCVSPDLWKTVKLRTMHAVFLALVCCCPQLTVAAEIAPLNSKLAALQNEQPILTITSSTGTVKLKLFDLERLPMYQATMKTYWGMNGTFQGVLMRDLMEKYKLNRKEKQLIFHALDNYSAGLSKGEFDRSQALLATRLNGQAIPLDNKGPLILLWPSREADALQGKSAPSSWIWSVSEISE